MKKAKPERLKRGDTIRVIAPSRSMSILGWSTIEVATKRLTDLGFEVTFGKNVMEKDEFSSSSVTARLEDLHDGFADSNVRCVLTAIGGFNSNQLLSQVDYSLLRANPKILCGYSDISALANAIYAKTGLITYSGPHFSSFAMKKGFDYTLEYFQKCLMQDEDIELQPSKEWSNDCWWMNQEERTFIPNEGVRLINRGTGSTLQGTIVGGNISAFAALQGTEFMPPFEENTILFLEECEEQLLPFFDRFLQSIIHQNQFHNVKAIVIGRFEERTGMSDAALDAIVRSKPQLQDVLVASNLNFGHTTPIFTFPIGGQCRIDLDDDMKVWIEGSVL
jgi:muramoyltetrapeptide carboxypeptidase